jgi:AcrR family transcriptional regulator
MPAGVREAQRIETRERLFDAAVAEIGRAGLAKADVSSIVAAAGVARGTFYFHFPTKEHVVVELERNEETRIIAELGEEAPSSSDLAALLTRLVRRALAAEKRLGPVLFREMLGLHFSPSRPVDDTPSKHPLAEYVIAAIVRAQRAGRVQEDADAGQLGVIFMTGLFALLSTADGESRAAILDRYTRTIVRGMEP